MVLCGRQNISFCGHRDDSKHLNEDRHNFGNFQALLDFRIDAGDKVLKHHFETSPRNATYRSKTIQNELIDCVATWIHQRILHEIKEAHYFSVLADETIDCSNKEQLTLVLRFVDNNRQIREEFLDYLQTPSTTGEALADLILSQVGIYGLDPNLIRGQGYDGATNMCGLQQGAATRICRLFPLALYVHCSSHVLNLCIIKACELQAVRNVLGTMTEVSLYFNNSAKWQVLLEKHIELCMPDSKKRKLVDLCKTRWVERHEAFESFSLLFKALVHAFEEVLDSQSHWSYENVATANELMLAITRFKFLVTFVVTNKCLAYLKA